MSEEELAALEAKACARKLTVSKWVRAELLEPRGEGQATVDEVLLGGVLALRTILLNLLFSVANGKAVIREWIERADGTRQGRS